jgi:hypothetical protein
VLLARQFGWTPDVMARLTLLQLDGYSSELAKALERETPKR